MEFRIADTLTNNLSRLTGEEQKSVKVKVKIKANAFGQQLNLAKYTVKTAI